jgi:hypothetical protein
MSLEGGILLCANCHAELAGPITLPGMDSATYNVAEPPESPG